MVQLYNPIGLTNELGTMVNEGVFDTSTVLSATFQDTLATNPVEQINRWRQLSLARSPSSAPQGLDQIEPISLHGDQLGIDFNSDQKNSQNVSKILSFNEQIDLLRKENLQEQITPVEGETDQGLALKVKWKKEELLRQDIIGKSTGGVLQTLGQFGVGLAASFLDPINIGVGFVPVVGYARYSAMLSRQATALGRFSVRTKVGMAEGLVGTALIEPAVLLATKETQYDYDLYDTFANLAFGTIIGGGLHGIGGLIFDKSGIKLSNLNTKRVSQAIDSTDEKSRSDRMAITLGQIVSGRQVVGLDTLTRKNLEESGNLEDGPVENRSIIKDTSGRTVSLDQGRLITLYASTGDNTQISFRNIEDAEKLIQKFQKKGLNASVKSLGNDDHRINIKVENTFLRGPDEEYITFRDINDAKKAVEQNTNPDLDLYPVKMADEYFLYQIPKKSNIRTEILQALDASADEINMPLEVNNVRSDINPESQGPTLEENLQQDVLDANSEKTLFNEVQEREIKKQADVIADDVFDNLDINTVEKSTDQLLEEIKIMEDEVVLDETTKEFAQNGQNDLENARLELEKTEQFEKAAKQAAVCILGGLG